MPLVAHLHCSDPRSQESCMSNPHLRRLDPDPRAPSHSPFANPGCKNRFLRLVRTHLGRGGGAVTIANGVARVDGDPMVHFLANLAQACNLLPEQEWPQAVAAHFAKSDPERLRGEAAAMVEGGFAAQADRIVVRIYPPDALSARMSDHFVQRLDLAETVTVLALDIGTSLMPVPRPIADSWQVPDAQLFDRALGNLERSSCARWSYLAFPTPRKIGIDLLDGDFHAATHILRRDPGLPRVGKAGNLIGIPACGVLFSYPLNKALDGLTLDSLLAVSLGKFHDGPNAISPHLYWRTPEGRLHAQRAQRHGGGRRFMPSPEFVEQMARLQEAGGGAGQR